ncbi:hypothetical protein GQ600_24458 [Phytophthora cactorum]|nr:hypothetical protein GQ600_24458 [Phytophthora cactorum]
MRRLYWTADCSYSVCIRHCLGEGGLEEAVDDPTEEANDEERAITGIVDKVAAPLKAGASKVTDTAKLRTQQLEGWMNNQKSVNDVISILRITDERTFFPISRQVDTLDEYIKFFNAKNPQQKTDLFRALRDGFGGEENHVGPKLPNNAFKRWIEKDYYPMSVLVKVFKVPEDDLASASAQTKKIIEQYKPMYYRVKGIEETAVVNPRRS